MRISKTTLLVAIAALAIAGQASANLIVNPGFEDPIGTEWTFTRVSGAEASWGWAASTARPYTGLSSLRMHFGPIIEVGKAYVEQVVTGLTPGTGYVVSAWINMDWRATKAWAYIEAVGGWGTVTAPPKGTNVDDVWVQYSVGQAADGDGNLTVRLYLDKYTTTTIDKDCIAYYDDISAAIPEPGSMLALLTGLVGLAAAVRRRK